MFLSIELNETKDPRKKVTIDDIVDHINQKQEKKITKTKKKAVRKGTSTDLNKYQEQNIFMGEDMNAKVPFQDCIEVEFDENGSVKCFKLRKNLTRLAAEKDEANMIQIIKNFEFSIAQLNQALFMKEKKEFKSSNTQTETVKPVLLSFLKQLLADFESYDGGEEARLDIEKELKNYTEYDLLNTEVTRITDTNDNLMTFKELMFSLFEYAKQKAISISYHRKENGEDFSLSKSLSPKNTEERVNTPNDSGEMRIMKNDTSRSIVVDMHNLPSRYDRSQSQESQRVRLNTSEGKNKVVAEIPLMKMVRDGIKRSFRRQETIDLFSLLQKHESINEAGLLKNIENRKNYILPLLENEGKPQVEKSSKKNPRPSHAGLGKYVDQGVSNRSITRMPPKAGSMKSNAG